MLERVRMKNSGSRADRHFFLEKENKRIYCVEYIADHANDNKQGNILAGKIEKHVVPELWDGKTAGRVVESIKLLKS